MMRFNDLEIGIAAGSCGKTKADVAVFPSSTPAVSADSLACGAAHIIFARAFDSDRCGSESAYRTALREAFEVSGLLGAKILIVEELSASSYELADSAAARIFSQEVFRFVRTGRRPLKKLMIYLRDGKRVNVFSKVMAGYLEHIRSVLSLGPFVTVDAIIEVAGGIVLIKRSNPPLGWALPGGFVDYGESLEDAVVREAKEETGLSITRLRQMATYSAPERDPRFHTISVVFTARAKGAPRAASDAAAVRIVRKGEWRNLPMAFDHAQILEDFIDRSKGK